MKKRILALISALALLSIISGVVYLNSLMPIITGYPAKYLCSAVFISNRDPAEVELHDLNFSFIKYTRNEVDYTTKSVTSHFLWGKSKAIFQDGFGAVLVNAENETRLKQRKFPEIPPFPYNQDTTEWPMGNKIPDTSSGIDKNALKQIASRLIQENAYKGNAYGFLVIHKGNPVVESYRTGFNEKTRFLSWSMAKSFTNALAGIMVKEKLLSIEQKAGIREWQSDNRKEITVNHLLQMESGLEWNEEYGNRSDVTLMLYKHDDFAQFAADHKPASPPGTKWYYSSGTTNIVNRIMRNCFSSDSAYYAHATTELFHKTGMANAIFETDAAGTLVGSSYVYATVRDYGRFGLLYLNDGVFNGERILPAGWATYSATPSPNSKDNYGAFFWLNRGGYCPDVPRDMFSCNGHDGQRIFIIPSKNLVVVVVGYSPKSQGSMDFNRLLKDISGTLQ
jgi:hypothetical protein